MVPSLPIPPDHQGVEEERAGQLVQPDTASELEGPKVNPTTTPNPDCTPYACFWAPSAGQED